jgi:hypothetical protein
MSLNSNLINVINDIETLNVSVDNINTSLSGKQSLIQTDSTITLDIVKANTIKLSGVDMATTLDSKQPELTRTSSLNINSLNVSSDTSSTLANTSGEIACNTLKVDGVEFKTLTGSDISNLIIRSTLSGNWKKVIYVPELALFVAINNTTTNSTIMTSSDGILWEYEASFPPYGLNDIVWSPELNRFVVIFDSHPSIYTSSDAETWTKQTTAFYVATLPDGRKIQVFINDLNGIVWSPERALFVSVSQKGFIITSSDGFSWTIRARPNGNVVGTSVIWSSELSLFVATFESGSYRIMISSNGTNWTTIAVSFNLWGDLVWSPDLRLFVAIADGGATTGNMVMTSSDARTWTDGSVSDFKWQSVAWSDSGYFVAVALDVYIMYSSDGFDWTDYVLSGVLRGVCWSSALGLFYIVGDDIVYSLSISENSLITATNITCDNLLINGVSINDLIDQRIALANSITA